MNSESFAGVEVERSWKPDNSMQLFHDEVREIRAEHNA
jgi:hypothetical protein